MQCQTVEDVLEWAERELCIVSATQDWAACIGQSAPVTASDYLAWWEDEVEIQMDNADEEDGSEHYADAEQTREYAEKIGEFCADLRELGIVPSVLPWNIGNEEESSNEDSSNSGS